MEIHSNNLTDSDIEIAVLISPSIFDRLRLDRFLPTPYNITSILKNTLLLISVLLLIFILVEIKESNEILKEHNESLDKHYNQCILH